MPPASCVIECIQLGPVERTDLEPDRKRLAISVDGLSKRFGSQTALDGLDLCVPRGVVAGFVGPNGAGKTTTLRILLGLLRPTAGTGTVLGRPLTEPGAYLPRVGAVIDAPAFYPGLSGAQNLHLLAAVGRLDPASIPAVLDRVGLSARAGDRYRTYSMGMKQRLGIAAALMGDPELLVLDEPTNGLDPRGIHDMRSLVKGLASAELTVLLSSHLLPEVEEICDWITLIDQGHQLYEGPTQQLLAAAAGLAMRPREPAALPRLAALVEAMGRTARIEGTTIVMALDQEKDADIDGVAAAINRAAFEHGIELVELRPVEGRLERTYLDLVRGGLT